MADEGCLRKKNGGGSQHPRIRARVRPSPWWVGGILTTPTVLSFGNSGKRASRSAAVFCIPAYTSISHPSKKKKNQPKGIPGQVTRSGQVKLVTFTGHFHWSSPRDLVCFMYFWCTLLFCLYCTTLRHQKVIATYTRLLIVHAFHKETEEPP